MREPEISPAREAELRARLERVSAIDLAHGLEYTLNRFSFYVQILRLFVSSNAGLPSQLRTLADQREQQELVDIIHGLKASTATIGAAALSARADAVLHAARSDHPQAIDLALQFADELERTISALEDALLEPGPSPYGR